MSLSPVVVPGQSCRLLAAQVRDSPKLLVRAEGSYAHGPGPQVDAHSGDVQHVGEQAERRPVHAPRRDAAALVPPRRRRHGRPVGDAARRQGRRFGRRSKARSTRAAAASRPCAPTSAAASTAARSACATAATARRTRCCCRTARAAGPGARARPGSTTCRRPPARRPRPCCPSAPSNRAWRPSRSSSSSTRRARSSGPI